MALGCGASSRRWADIESDDDDNVGAFAASEADGKFRGGGVESDDDRATSTPPSEADSDDASFLSPTISQMSSDNVLKVLPVRWRPRKFFRSVGAPGDACSEPSTPSLAAPTGSEGIGSDDDGSAAPPMTARRDVVGLQGCVGLSALAMPSEVQLPIPYGRGSRGAYRQRKCRGHRSAMQDNGQRACGVKQPPSSTEGSADVETQSVWVERLPPKLCHDFFLRAIFEQAGVLPSVLKYHVVPEASGAALLVEFSDQHAAKAYVEHFSLPLWAEHGVVKAKVLAPVRPAAQQP